jgi:hypothetical protein
MRTVTAQGRWVWGISGLVTAALIAVPGVHLITSAGGSVQSAQPHLQGVMTRTMIVSQRVTSLTVQSYGAPVQVTGGPVSHVKVTEIIGTGPGGTPGVTVIGDRLTVGSPACGSWESCDSFAVIVPRNMTVTVASQGGPVTVSGVAGVNLNSGGGSMNVSGIDGPVTVAAEGGPVQLAGVTGPVQADTGGGSLLASGITAVTATVTADGGPVQLLGRIGTLHAYTGGGSASITLSAAPLSVTLDSDGGPAMLAVPGGPYAVTADSDGGPETLDIATNPGATRSITISSGGGALQLSS